MKYLHGNKSIIREWRCLLTIITLFMSGVGGVQADTVGFNPSINNVGIGETFDVNIEGDFTELYGGVIDLGFDSTAVRINMVTIDPFFDFLPDGGGPAAGDVWPGISFDFFDPFDNDPPARGVFTIATINITALALGTSSLAVLGSSTFYGKTDPIFPTLNTASINAVPVPAAMWLFGSGLLGLVGMARRKKAA